MYNPPHEHGNFRYPSGGKQTTLGGLRREASRGGSTSPYPINQRSSYQRLLTRRISPDKMGTGRGFCRYSLPSAQSLLLSAPPNLLPKLLQFLDKALKGIYTAPIIFIKMIGFRSPINRRSEELVNDSRASNGLAAFLFHALQVLQTSRRAWQVFLDGLCRAPTGAPYPVIGLLTCIVPFTRLEAGGGGYSTLTGEQL